MCIHIAYIGNPYIFPRPRIVGHYNVVAYATSISFEQMQD